MPVEDLRALGQRLPSESYGSAIARKIGQKSTRGALMKVGAAAGIAGQQFAQTQAEKEAAEQGYKDAAAGTESAIGKRLAGASK